MRKDLFDMESTLSQLENSFETFQNTQQKHLNKLEEKMTYLTAYKNRPQVESFLETKNLNSKDFREFIHKGTLPLTQKALSSQTQGGGFLLSQPLKEFVQNSLETVSPLRNLCRVTTITTEALDLVLDQGVSEVGWSGEEESPQETKTPEIKKISVPVHQLYAKPKVSQKLLDDAGIDVESYLLEKISEQMGQKETHSFIFGDGKRKPRGFLSYDQVELKKGTFGTIEALKTQKDGEIESIDCLMDLFQALPQEYMPGAVWFMSRSALMAIRRLCDKTGNSFWQPSLSLESPSTLLGHNVIICDEMPSVTKGTPCTGVAFANFKKAYQIVDRSEVQVLRDPYSCKPFVEFYATKRVGGDVFNFDAIKVLSFSA